MEMVEIVQNGPALVQLDIESILHLYMYRKNDLLQRESFGQPSALKYMYDALVKLVEIRSFEKFDY